jgi:hypothetical protein
MTKPKSLKTDIRSAQRSEALLFEIAKLARSLEGPTMCRSAGGAMPLFERRS